MSDTIYRIHSKNYSELLHAAIEMIALDHPELTAENVEGDFILGKVLKEFCFEIDQESCKYVVTERWDHSIIEVWSALGEHACADTNPVGTQTFIA